MRALVSGGDDAETIEAADGAFDGVAYAHWASWHVVRVTAERRAEMMLWWRGAPDVQGQRESGRAAVPADDLVAGFSATA